jgi:hypothetical protein
MPTASGVLGAGAAVVVVGAVVVGAVVVPPPPSPPQEASAQNSKRRHETKTSIFALIDRSPLYAFSTPIILHENRFFKKNPTKNPTIENFL